MAHRQFECPVPRISEVPKGMVAATASLESAALKWRQLAERRRDHYIELYKTGRWRHYCTDLEFLTKMRAAIALAQRWAKISPLPEERRSKLGTPVDAPKAKAA